jgi:hypothetical protein
MSTSFAGAHVVEGTAQAAQLGLSSRNLSTDQELTGNVVPTQDQRGKSGRSPLAFGERDQIAQQPMPALIALVGIFREQLGHELRNDRRDVGHDLRHQRRALGHVCVCPTDGIVRDERQPPGQHLEERDTQRIVVCPVVGAAIETARAFRRDMGQRGRKLTAGVCARRFGDSQQIGKLDTASLDIDHEAARAHVLVKEPTFVQALQQA